MLERQEVLLQEEDARFRRDQRRLDAEPPAHRFPAAWLLFRFTRLAVSSSAVLLDRTVTMASCPVEAAASSITASMPAARRTEFAVTRSLPVPVPDRPEVGQPSRLDLADMFDLVAVGVAHPKSRRMPRQVGVVAVHVPDRRFRRRQARLRQPVPDVAGGAHLDRCFAEPVLVSVSGLEYRLRLLRKPGQQAPRTRGQRPAGPVRRGTAAACFP
jgi:hypothetical protein